MQEGDIYDVYHSVHETFNWISQFADPDFSRHLAMALVWSKLAMALATTPLLPFDPRDYAGALSRIYGNLEEVYGDELAAQNITLGGWGIGSGLGESGCVLWVWLEEGVGVTSGVGLKGEWV